MRYFLSLIVCLGLLLSTNAPAATLTAIDSGFVTSAGGSAKGDGTVTAPAKYNYSVGWELHYGAGFLGSPLAPMERRNYFVFDFTGITDPIGSATLRLWTGTYESVHATELFGIKEITDPAGALGLTFALASGTSTSDFDGPGDPLIGAASTLFSKLGDGPLILGSILLSSAVDDSYVDITFTPGGVGYLNGFLGGKFVLGGLVGTIVPPAAPQQPFGLTGPDIPGGDPKTPMLIITSVPEPSSATLLIVAGGVVLVSLRRKRALRV